MMGNVWEWCADWYDAEYYGRSPGEDPPGPSAGRYRVLRGGSWAVSAAYCRSAVRHPMMPVGKGYDIGFRTIRTPDPGYVLPDWIIEEAAAEAAAAALAAGPPEPERSCPEPPPGVRVDIMCAPVFGSDWEVRPEVIGWGPDSDLHPGRHIIGLDGGVLVWVPPGEFMMGSPDGEGERDEHPQHRVRLTRGFWLGKYEVTNEQYRAFCQATGRQFPSDSKNGPKHPVLYVSWEDARAYCEHYGLTLPTEAQWEYAARGPEGRRYPWGAEWDARKCCNWENRGRGDIKTLEVGSLPAGNSWCGASDMAGNVWEWCADWWDSAYYTKSPAEDPPGPSSGEYRVLRGGSWHNVSEYLFRCACRFGIHPSGRDDGSGFRGARTP